MSKVPFDNLSNTVFIKLCRDFAQKETTIDQMRLIVKQQGQGTISGLLEPISRVIDNVTYTVGFKINCVCEAEMIVNYFIPIFAANLHKAKIKSIKKRLKTSNSLQEKIDLLEHEITSIKDKVNKSGSEPFRNAYSAEKNKTTPFPLHKFKQQNFKVPNEVINEENILLHALGYSESKTERMCKAILSRIKK